MESAVNSLHYVSYIAYNFHSLITNTLMKGLNQNTITSRI